MCHDRKGRPVSADVARRLRQLVDEHGEWKAARVIGLSAHTLLRALGGFPVYSSTEDQIIGALADGPADEAEAA